VKMSKKPHSPFKPVAEGYLGFHPAMKRKKAMAQLRDAVKTSVWCYTDIAQTVGVSSGWIGKVLRGHYPHHDANKLPKNIRVALQNLGFDIPEILWTF